MKQQKRLLVSFLVIASILVFAGLASALPITSSVSVKVNDVDASSASVLAGETVSVVVQFASAVDSSDVKLSATIEGKNDVEKEVFVGDVENGKTYTKTLTLEVPYELKDKVSDDFRLVIKIWNGEFSGSTEYSLRVQRQSYSVKIMSLSTVGNANAGQIIPVDIVLKNTGYNQLDDLYAKLSVPALNLDRTVYFGDLVAIEGDDDDDTDTVSGRVFLEIPFNAKSGEYVLEVEIKNGDFEEKVARTIFIANSFESNLVASNLKLTARAGESVTYTLELVNPTSEIKVYSIVPETTAGVTMSADSMVTVPAGSSKTVSLNVRAESEGSYNLSVNVFSNGQLTGQTSLVLEAVGGASSPIVILTVVLAVIFVVLLAILLVLVTKKPKKQEGFEESYY
ncbi:MAG: hypothetical protein PHH00_01640 [Candidatus Nanoarchaeia archaeon]|nr:hypothetical protein [Candidatus Nanoarchaeia archaeon]